MKNIIIILITCFAALAIGKSQSQPHKTVISDDVTNFWKAYDLIKATSDTSQHFEILKREFIDKGTDGLESLMDKKGYTIQEYLYAIRTYPSFWESVRTNTSKASEYATSIEHEVNKLKEWYPDLKPAHIYFSIGVLRTGGTAHDGHVLIGSELALADSTVVTKDIQPNWLKNNLAIYMQSNPIEDAVLLNAHEYVHTQQGDYGYDLLSQTIFEGVAEFVSVLSHGGDSATPAVAYGAANYEKVRSRFEKEMFSPQWNDWLYNNSSNEFGLRDMGYYVGYAICEKYFNNSEDKKGAIKKMIELDCSNQADIEQFADASGYFSNSLETLYNQYLNNQPVVLGIQEFQNKSKNVDPSTHTITIAFSREMTDRFKNLKLGPLGENNLLPVTGVAWADDMQSITYDVELEPNQRYQILLDNQFRAIDGPVIEKYLIDFRTAE